MSFGFGDGVTAGRPPVQKHTVEEVVARPQAPMGAFWQDFYDRRRRGGSNDQRHG